MFPARWLEPRSYPIETDCGFKYLFLKYFIYMSRHPLRLETLWVNKLLRGGKSGPVKTGLRDQGLNETGTNHFRAAFHPMFPWKTSH